MFIRLYNPTSIKGSLSVCSKYILWPIKLNGLETRKLGIWQYWYSREIK